jgi:hypothetical protein
MTETELIKWLERLLRVGRDVPTDLGARPIAIVRDTQRALAWIAEAQSAIAGAFPMGHAVKQRWGDILERSKSCKIDGFDASALYYDAHFGQLLGVLEGGLAVLKGGHLQTLLDGIRAETVSEVLDQAETLLNRNYVVAAAILAGGALETHLLHLCVRLGISVAGEGSISKYDGAIGQARKSGDAGAYTVTDSKLVTSWGGIRNEAAHDPTKFKQTATDVQRMIAGIREFTARNP